MCGGERRRVHCATNVVSLNLPSLSSNRESRERLWGRATSWLESRDGRKTKLTMLDLLDLESCDSRAHLFSHSLPPHTSKLQTIHTRAKIDRDKGEREAELSKKSGVWICLEHTTHTEGETKKEERKTTLEEEREERTRIERESVPVRTKVPAREEETQHTIKNLEKISEREEKTGWEKKWRSREKTMRRGRGGGKKKGRPVCCVVRGGKDASRAKTQQPGWGEGWRNQLWQSKTTYLHKSSCYQGEREEARVFPQGHSFWREKTGCCILFITIPQLFDKCQISYADEGDTVLTIPPWDNVVVYHGKWCQW